MSDKTKEQLEDFIDVDRKLKIERDVSDKVYAIKLVEYIVFTMMGIIASTFLYRIIAVVFQQYVK